MFRCGMAGYVVLLGGQPVPMQGHCVWVSCLSMHLTDSCAFMWKAPTPLHSLKSLFHRGQ